MNIECDAEALTLSDKTEHTKLKDYFNDLPEELQIKIFSKFSPTELCKDIAPVCKKWWNLSKDASLWKDLSFTISAEKPIKTYCEVLIRCTQLSTLKIKSAVPLELIILCFLELRPHSLKELDLGFCKGLNITSINIIVSNCPQIECLNLEGCGLGIDCNCIDCIITLPNLRSLNLSRCINIDDLCIKAIAKDCSKLELLNIDNISRITDEAICDLAERRHETLAHLFLDGEDLTDQSMISLSTCQNLFTLTISCGELFTDDMLEALSSLPHLSWLKLRESPNLSPTALAAFFANPQLSSLEILEMENLMIDDSGLHNLAQTCRNLKILSLPLCYDISDKGLQEVIDNCSSLFWLDLSFVNQITEESLMEIPTKLSDLKYLNLIECNEVMDYTICHLAKQMPNLKVNTSNSEHFTHADSEEEAEVSFVVNKKSNVCWTKMPEGFCSRLGKMTSTDDMGERNGTGK